MKGAPGAIRGVLGASGGVGSILGQQGVLVLRGQEGYRWHKGALGIPRGVRGLLGCVGVSVVHWGGKWTGSLTTLGSSTPTGSPWGVTYLTKARHRPLSRVPSLPLVSPGE